MSSAYTTGSTAIEDNMDRVGDNWKLLDGDQLLGTLQRRETDMPWFICEFAPTDAFEREYRARFKESNRLFHEDVEEWEPFYDELIAGLTLEAEPGTANVTDFILHVEGIEARLRLILESY
jgi:hypothetical protein